YVRGRDGIESGQQPASHQRKREALVAVAVIVAAGDGRAIQLLVELGDHAVDPVVGFVGGCDRSCRRTRPWMPRQQVRDHGINYAAVVGDRLIDIRLGWYGDHSWNAQAFALPFVRDKEKGLVGYDRAPDRAAELVVVKDVLRLPDGIEKVARIQRVIA